jgi:hypothetical protein
VSDQAVFLDDGFVWRGRFYPTISGGNGSTEGDLGSGGEGGTGSGNSDATSGANDGGSGSGVGAGGGSDKTFTQEEVNALIARETAKAQRGKLDPSELGFESAKAMKEYLDSAKARDEAAKDDQQRKVDEAVDAAKQEAEGKVLKKANDRLVAAEFKVAAAHAGVSAVDDALVLARTMDIWKQMEIVEQGEDVVIKGFDDAFFEELKKAKPFLFASEGGGTGGSGDIGAGAGGSNSGAGGKSDEQLHKLYPALPN